MNKKRVAVLYSGQARTWKTCLENNLRFYRSIEDTEVDVFYHTWDNTETVQSMSQAGSIQFGAVDESTVTEINDVLCPKAYEVSSYYGHEIFKNRWMCLFYSFSRAVNIMKEYALEHGIKYDLVIKARFDIVYDPTSNLPTNLLNRANEGYLLTSHCNNMPMENFSYNFNDVSFYGSMYAFDLLGNLFFERKPYLDKFYRGESSTTVEELNHFDGPGVMIYKYMVKHNIRMYDLFRLHEFIVREDSEHDPNTTEGFKYFVEKHWEWYK